MASSGIKASDIMNRNLVIASPDLTISELAQLLNKFRIGGAPVVEEGRLVGVITERDLMTRVIAVDKQPSQTFVKDVMTSPPTVFAEESEDMNSIAYKMAKHDVTRMPIVNSENDVVGIVTNRDILKNSSELIDVLIEQARIKGFSKEHNAFGKCESCGDSTNLSFKKGSFLCDVCV